MEFINTLSILLLLVAVAITVVACVVIFNRRRQAQSAADKVRRKAAEEKQHREVEQEAVRRAEEEERQRVEAERGRLEEELRRAKEERHKAEEERKHLDEEARREIQEAQRKEAQRLTEELRKAEEEQRRRETDEAQRKAEELQVAEEEDRRSEEEGKRLEEENRRNEEEECNRLEEEERRKAGEVQREVDKERKRLEPGNRGGRPRAPTRDREKQPLQEGKPRCPKPEIVCWKRERQWIPAVEVPEELFESPNLAVLQNGLPLTQDESREGCWHLKEAYGQVVVQWKEDKVAREIKIALGEENYLLFKLSGQNQNQGRHVKSPSSGSYLLMVLDDWERDDTLSGSPPAAPEHVSLAGYKAHFFELEKDGDGKIAFRAPMGRSFVIESQALQFELVGSRLNEASGEKGPLFGERPPQIRAPDNQGWKDVGTIVVGEEGSGKGRWRMAFSPVRGLIEQDLPSEIADRKGGWYFLRFYDMNDDLVESLDFRFLYALEEINILQPSPLPPEDGHKPMGVKFLHKPGCLVQPADVVAASVQIERTDDKTILVVPANPAFDETRWLVGPEGGPQVEATILVERLWWAIGEEDNAPSEWKDQLLTLARADFAAASKKALWLRLPKRRWADRVLVGFEQPKARPYDVKVTEKTIAVPFREFGDSEEVGDRTQEHSLKVWIKRDNGHDEGVVEGVVAIIPKVEKEKRLLLNLDRISAPRLATVLTRLRKKTVGLLRVLVKEVRKKYSRERTARKSESVEFNRYALCMIALTLELTPQIPGLNRYAVRAQLARDKFPEIMNRLRNRYKEISTSRAYRAGIEGKHNESN